MLRVSGETGRSSGNTDQEMREMLPKPLVVTPTLPASHHLCLANRHCAVLQLEAPHLQRRAPGASGRFSYRRHPI